MLGWVNCTVSGLGTRIEVVGEKHWMIHNHLECNLGYPMLRPYGLRIEVVGEKHWMIHNHSGCNSNYPMLRPSGIED